MKNHTSQKGSALIYILIAIALLAALTASFMDSSSQQTSSQNTFNTVTEIKSQINLIRSSVQECILTYPEGDAGADGNSGLRSPVTPNYSYPVNPSSGYFTAPAAPEANDNVSFIKCPGNPGNSKLHAPIFGGNSGKFLPPPPNLFNDWVYYNGADGVFFFTATNKTDPYLTSSLEKLDDQFSECEADVIDNVANAGALAITTDGVSGPQCPAKSRCFRVWMIATDPQYVGDTGTDESACP